MIRTIALLIAATSLVAANEPPAIYSKSAIHHPVTGRHGMVASQESHATRAAIAALEAGGNAIDAAATASFTLAVTLPRAGNLGGGGFMLVHLAASGETHALDFRETAPAAATPEMFLGEDTLADPAKSRSSHLGVGVPGSVAGTLDALARWGTFSPAQALAPAIRLAEEGFPISEELASILERYQPQLTKSPAAAAVFYKEDGTTTYSAGEILRQPDLAATLRLIARDGVAGFYQGKTAEAITADMQTNGGLITLEDLANYTPVLRKPLTTTYRGHPIATMPPPSAGGVLLCQMLGMLQALPDPVPPARSAASYHRLAEVMKRAFADRSAHLGDPAFSELPLETLLSPATLIARAATIDADRATPSAEIAPTTLPPPREESPQTTHFSIIDAAGNTVSTTTTLNHSFGLRHMVPGTGFLLNNELDDFAAAPGAPDSYGLVSGAKNLPAPGKRPLSSMAPTIVFHQTGGPWIATGSPGGSKIPTAILQVLTNSIDHKMNLAEATHAPRLHHQWLPDMLLHENNISPDTLTLLQNLGHHLEPSSAIGSTQSIQMDAQGTTYRGSSDPRRPGALATAPGR